MCLCQIVHMDVIAHAGSVRSRVLVSEDFKRRTLSPNRLKSRRDEVRLGFVHLADRAVFVRSSRVEIAKAYVTQTVSWSV